MTLLTPAFFNKASTKLPGSVDVEVTAVNEKLQDDPATVNSSPEEEGWLVKAEDLSGEDAVLVVTKGSLIITYNDDLGFLFRQFYKNCRRF